MSRIERIMDMINMLCLDDGRLNYRYIYDKYGLSNREFRRDIDFIRERLTDVGYMDKRSTVTYVREPGGNYYVFNGDKPKLNEAFVNSTIAEALASSQENTLRDQFDFNPEGEKDKTRPVRYIYQALEKVNYAIFTTLVAAIKEKRVVRVKYTNAKGLSTDQELWPLELINYSQIWYLSAVNDRGWIRRYSLSRIHEARLEKETFVYDNQEAIEKSKEGYGIYGSSWRDSNWYTMRFEGTIANIVANQTWHSEEKARWISDTVYEKSVPAINDVELMNRVLSFSPDAYPVDPPEFVERYRSIISACRKRMEEEA